MGAQNFKYVELFLGLGFLAIGVAVFVARSSPATGYETSIYTSTPDLTWGLLLFALVVAIWTILQANVNNGLITVAMILGGVAMTALASIPLIRGHYYFGRADSLTHLGWTRDIAGGIIDPHNLFYPGIHSIAVAIARFTGMSLESGLMVTVVVLFLGFLIFVPLTVLLVTGNTRAMGIAAVVSWFVLPINNIATHFIPHTNSLALFYTPILLFFLVLYLRSSSVGTGVQGVTPVGIVLVILSFGLVLVHIQHAINVLIVFLAICAVQFVSRRWRVQHNTANHRPLYFQTGLLGVLVAIWFVVHDTVARGATLTIQNMFYGGVGTTATVTQRTGSLLAVGGSLGELFVKLFLVSALVGVITLGYLIALLRRQRRGSPETRQFFIYISLAFVPLGVLFVAYFFGTGTMAFRQVGLIYVLLTILGAIAITSVTAWADQTLPLGSTVVGVILVIFLVLSLLTVFASPYIYSPSPTVTEQEMRGYEATFDTRSADVPMATLSTQSFRYGDAYYGTTRSNEMDYTGTGEGLLLPFAINEGNPSQAYPNEKYYAVFTESDMITELMVYREINYRQAGLDAFDTQSSSNRVLSNGEFTLYLVSDDVAG